MTQSKIAALFRLQSAVGMHMSWLGFLLVLDSTAHERAYIYLNVLDLCLFRGLAGCWGDWDNAHEDDVCRVHQAQHSSGTAVHCASPGGCSLPGRVPRGKLYLE